MRNITPELPETSPHELEQLINWVPDGAGFGVMLSHNRSAGKWYATVLDFNLAGTGDTQQEALQEMFELMTEYLLAFMREGRSFEDAIRRVPFVRRAKFAARVGMTKALQRLPRHRDSASKKWEIPFSAPHFV